MLTTLASGFSSLVSPTPALASAKRGWRFRTVRLACLLGAIGVAPLQAGCGSGAEAEGAPVQELPDAATGDTTTDDVHADATDASVDSSDGGGQPDVATDASGDATGQDANADAPAPDGATVDASADSSADDGGQSDAAIEADAAVVPPPTDPAQNGPYAYSEPDISNGFLSTIHCDVPSTGPSGGPYPVVLFAHGFMIDSSRYYTYGKRLASFGYVTCYVAYSDLQGQDKDPGSISGALDWVLAQSAASGNELSGLVDGTRAGVMGHSRGGKAAVNAAVQDPRFKAVLGLDPVNNCPMGTCPDAIAGLAGAHLPSAFLGETTDNGVGSSGQACAPAADNFEMFYASAPSPSLKVNVAGADHISFVDDVNGFCLACGQCTAGTTDRAIVLELAWSYSVAFFERYLRGNAAYDTYLTGTLAQQKYVQTGIATIASK